MGSTRPRYSGAPKRDQMRRSAVRDGRCPIRLGCFGTLASPMVWRVQHPGCVYRKRAPGAGIPSGRLRRGEVGDHPDPTRVRGTDCYDASPARGHRTREAVAPAASRGFAEDCRRTQGSPGPGVSIGFTLRRRSAPLDRLAAGLGPPGFNHQSLGVRPDVVKGILAFTK